MGGVTIIHGYELWIYYIGFAGDENKNNLSWVQNGMYCSGATGIAKLRRDGFVSMNGNGALLTRKLECKDKTALYINADGKVSVEVISADGTTLAISKPFEGNSTKAKISIYAA